MKLDIGGTQPHPDWKILDIEPRPEVDFVGDAADLSQFPDESISTIYASHVLEHFHYGLDYELSFVLAEWFCVLVPGGQLMLSVPNLRTLCWLYCDPTNTKEERFTLMRIMFGGQVNEYDVHKVGFDADILTEFLTDVGFAHIKVVDEFHLFEDDSTLRWKGHLISLNVIATK
jgi:predicted SAM-dependent methyltransferase